MAKIQLKSDNINPFGGLFSIFKQFDRSGLRQTIDSTLGKRGTTKAAFSYGDVFASLFGSYLCGGDCIEDSIGGLIAGVENRDWTEVTIGGQRCGVTSFKFDSMLPELNLRLVVQRTPVTDEDPDAEPEGLFGTEYVYRCIVTNDWDKSEREIICYYNKRGASERNFDCQNNDFGWAHLPFSFLSIRSPFLDTESG